MIKSIHKSYKRIVTAVILSAIILSTATSCAGNTASAQGLTLDKKVTILVKSEVKPEVKVEKRDDWKLLNLKKDANQMVSPVSINQALGLLAHGFKSDSPQVKAFLKATGYKSLAEYDAASAALIAAYPDTGALSNKQALLDKYAKDKDAVAVINDYAEKGYSSDYDREKALAKKYPGFSRELYSLNEKTPPAVSVANHVWYIDKAYTPAESYQDIVGKTFGAGAEYAAKKDFVSTVNKWTAEKTRGKITKIIDDSVVKDPDFKALLENAVYFKASWAEQFKKSATENGEFTNISGSKVMTKLMHQTGKFGYYEGTGYKALKLKYFMPYAENAETQPELFMLVILPDDAKKFKMTEAVYTAALSGIRTEEVRVTLPKFKTEFSLESELLNYLEPLKLFGESNLTTEMFKIKAGQKPVYASDIIHKTVIDLDEDGTEAAAVTAIMMTTNSMVVQKPKVCEFTADKPFYYAIADNAGNKLFIGQQTEFKAG